jgi:hypothetical protein
MFEALKIFIVFFLVLANGFFVASQFALRGGASFSDRSAG